MSSVSVTFSYNPDHYPGLHAWLESLPSRDKSARWREFMTEHLGEDGLQEILEAVQRIETELKRGPRIVLAQESVEPEPEPAISAQTRANLVDLGRRQ